MQLPRGMCQRIPGKAPQRGKQKRAPINLGALFVRLLFLICPPAAAVDRLRRQVQRCTHLRVALAPHVALDKARRLVRWQLKR